MACTFATSQLPKVVREWCALYILTSKNVLRATTACTFSTYQLVKVVRTPGVFCTFGNVLRATTACNCSSLIWPAGSAPAALASLLLRPSGGATNHWKKHSVSRLSYLFARLHLLSSYSFSSTLLSSDLSLLSASALLCFSSVHIVGSLTSKLPSTIHICKIYYIVIYIYICICILYQLNYIDSNLVCRMVHIKRTSSATGG